MIALDHAWLAAHPLPQPAVDTDKNDRGHVLVAGGSLSVPGALALTGEAAFRVGAGKVQLATVAPAALSLGIGMPEAAVFELPVNAEGELAGAAGAPIAQYAEKSDVLVLGPGMGQSAEVEAILAAILQGKAVNPVVLDAAMLHCVGNNPGMADGRQRPLILTPHPGEMASLMRCDKDEIDGALAEAAAARFSATIVSKGATSWIASAGVPTLRYPGGGPGLATSGSGDVLAGILGGLLARGVPPHIAAGWAVWLHGEAGRRLATEIGPVGFLARELLPHIPQLMKQADDACR